MIRQFGLIGYPLSHSFSQKYFADKFAREGLSNLSYHNFPIEEISLLPQLVEQHPSLIGLNVTIPYKEVVIDFLDNMASDAAEINAVNTIVILSSGRLHGYNTDIYGFDRSLSDLLPSGFQGGALVLGSGGASKAVRYVCEKRKIPYLVVSRKKSNGYIGYEEVTKRLLEDYCLVVNTTPLGMYPAVDTAPPIPYGELTEAHYLYDLVYNPAPTRFLRLGAAQQSHTKNGLDMLALQAERSWQIWNNPPEI